MKVFVTGHLGYIGVHLVKQLKEHGHYVKGCDIGLFENCAWQPYIKPDEELIRDIRMLTPEDLEGYDCVMHLAAISNDPMGDLDAGITYDINLHGSVKLAETAKAAGVSRFLFSGSCSVYGKGEKPFLSETDPLNPVSAYAVSKIESEKLISPLADNHFTPVYLRNATAYGYSPMLRIDLVVNNLLGCAHARGDIRIMSDGSPWRPLIHCSDIAKAFVHLMQADREKVANRAINIGGNPENYQVKQIADYVKELMPSCNIVFTGEAGDDPRNYQVNFDLLSSIAPDFRLDYTVWDGMQELHRYYHDLGFSLTDFEGDRFVRLRTLKHQLHLLNQHQNIV